MRKTLKRTIALVIAVLPVAVLLGRMSPYELQQTLSAAIFAVLGVLWLIAICALLA